MRKPVESLDDYSVKPSSEVAAPSRKTSPFTDELEDPKPLAVREDSGRSGYDQRSTTWYHPTWFRRALTVRRRFLVLLVLTLVSAMLIGINDPTVAPDLAKDRPANAPKAAMNQADTAHDDAISDEPDETLVLEDEPFSSDLEPASNYSRRGHTGIVRRTPRRKSVRSRGPLAFYRPRPYRRPLRPEIPKFVPTTIVIYVEDGVIKTRVEPWIQSNPESNL